MEVLKKTRAIHIMVACTLLLLVAVFYWYEWRPSAIRKECHVVAVDKAIEKNKRKKPDATGYTKTDRDAYYKWCLQSKGLRY